jgi:hypothetical protein
VDGIVDFNSKILRVLKGRPRAGRVGGKDSKCRVVYFLGHLSPGATNHFAPPAPNLVRQERVTVDSLLNPCDRIAHDPCWSFRSQLLHDYITAGQGPGNTHTS